MNRPTPSALLLTQCLQRDFVGPLGPLDPLPNSLHIGAEESRRLLGPAPERGPLAQLMGWAEAAGDGLAVAHVRDWHDGHDPLQREHLDRFGNHCLANSEGAALVLDLDDAVDGARVCRIDALTLNDAVDSGLDAVIAPAIAAHGADALRVAVIGVWTEAKVTFLLYELATRWKVRNLATCSALTASSSRDRHFAALDQLRRVLGVRVFDSVGDLAAWLQPTARPLELPPELDSGRLEIEQDPDHPLKEPALDEPVLRALYPEAVRVRLRGIGGGFSGAQVFRVDGRDLSGHAIAPTVLKLGPRVDIAGERRAFEAIEGVLGNDAPSVRGLVEVGPRAGLKYAYAAMGGSGVRTMQSLWQDAAAPLDADRAGAIAEAVFGRILGRLTAARRYEPLDLLKEYTFDARYADKVRQTVDATLAEGRALGLSWRRDPRDDARLELGDGRSVACPSTFYRDGIALLARQARRERHWTSWVHGDLNYANILVDEPGNVWVIDFARARRTHASMDLHKAENDLLYLLTPIPDVATLHAATALTDALLQVDDLAAPLAEACPVEGDASLGRTWALLRQLRLQLARGLESERNPAHIDLPLLRYAVHTLSFSEPTVLQRCWALATAAQISERLLQRARRDSVLRADAVTSAVLDQGALSLTICPGRADRGRDLESDLDDLVQQGVQTLVTLISDEELDSVGVLALPERARSRGIEVLRLSMFDQGAPPTHDADILLAAIGERLDAGRHVCVHCMGGLGRTGAVAAAVLVDRGLDADAAIAEVRRVRSPRAIETAAQEAFVRQRAASMGRS